MMKLFMTMRYPLQILDLNKPRMREIINTFMKTTMKDKELTLEQVSQ